jgi:hypothetical protein
MIERGHEKRFRIREVEKDVCQKDISFLLKGFQVSHRLKGVSAHGKEMVMIELNAVQDRFELRNQSRQKAGLQHLIESVKRIGRVQNAQKTACGSFGGPEGIVHKVQEFTD